MPRLLDYPLLLAVLHSHCQKKLAFENVQYPQTIRCLGYTRLCVRQPGEVSRGKIYFDAKRQKLEANAKCPMVVDQRRE